LQDSVALILAEGVAHATREQIINLAIDEAR
jgi:hypothetical protein